ncbi:type VI secretion system membrane subunit TssM [Phytobacter massiliensis]|uniref:type VI secretion system membrane subunit TssM n=1 Tax=Phytobacter massiliensis TaxID=1485952 RepID=UPI001651F964|nr:type VI secretion system membrane subunit TssM [Phytobacter massiliensis]
MKKQTEDDPLKAELVALQEYLSGWMAKLRQHYNQDEKFRYRLPWYVFIGDKSSGKSTLIREGVQRVSLSEADDDNSHCTNYVECYLTEQAVIFDIDGNLVNQHSVEEHTTRKFNRLWVALLEWFATERSRQPLNGVVITVDIHRFISSEQHQREQYIAMLRQRLADIERKLQCKLPVYIVLTRLDLFYGFEAMFQSLDKVQRDAILGVTFSTNATEWQQELDNFWHEWIKKINIALPEMMLNDVDSHQRSALFTFSRQMFGIKEYATWLLDALIYGQENILLRGIYLTSSVHKGQMDDIFVKSAAAQYHLSKQPYPTWQSVVNVPYFTRDLFKEVIFSEANLAGENRVYIQHAQSKVKIFGALCAVCVVGVWGAWQYYYRQNFQAGEMVLTQAKAFMNIPVPEGNDYYGNLQLPLLNPLGDAMFAYGNYHEHMPVLADAGLYQGYKIGPYIEKTYLSLLEQRFLPAIMDGLIGELKAAPAGSEQKLNILRIIRMIEDESGRNKKLVLSYMQERWSQRFPGQKDIQDHLWQHLDYALDHVQWKKDRDEGNKAAIDTFKPYSKTIADAQQELGKLSIYQRVYQNLRIKAGDALPQDLNLKTQIGATFDTVFIAAEEQKLRVPQFLTHSGLMNYYLEQNDQLIDLTSMDSWVLNLTNNVAYSDADRAEIHRQITEQYASDYISTWHSAIANISVREFTDISDAIRTLESTIGGEQPLKKALLILKDNTQPAALVTEKDKSESNRDDQRLINRIYREFITETSVLDESNAQLSTMQNVTQKLSNLHRYLLSIQNAPEPGKAALKAVQLHLEQGSSDPVFELQQLAKTVPDPLGRWINELATQAWKVVVKTSVQSLETEWNEKVVKPFNLNLVDRYPFNATSKQDVALSEFEQFFRTGGTIDAFYQENLKFFMENGNLKEASLIRPDVIKQLAMAERIRKTFFGPQNELGIQYAIQPVDLSGSKRRAVMNLDGQLVEYSHGRANKVLLIWPNSMRESIESKVTLIPVTGQASKSISAAGVWAQFRLVNAGMLSNINGGSFDVRYTVDGGYVVYRIFVDSTENPFAGGLFTQFRLPETLY